MTLVFPRPMPAQGVRAVSFELRRVDYASPEAGGGGGAVSAGLPRWAGRWTLTDGLDWVGRSWRPWVSSLRGSQRLFIGRDTARPWPAYWRRGLPQSWSGACTGWSATISAGQPILTVSGLPAGMGVAALDYVDLRWFTGGVERRFLVRCVEDNGASGGTSSFPIEPAVPSWVPSNAVAHFDKPGCLMRLLPDETQIAETDMTRAGQGASVVAGAQVLLP